MSQLVESVTISRVADLYLQYSRFARHYDLADNPLTGLTRYIPSRANFYTVVSETDATMAQDLMKIVAGRRKLRAIRVAKDEIKSPVFSPTDRMIIFYV